MNQSSSRKSICLLILYGLILTAALLLTVFGARITAALTRSQEENDRRRAAAAYVQNRIQAADAEGGVILGEGPEGDMLILREGDSGYETRIYCYQGELREELSRTGSALSPETAQTICGTETFSVARQDDGSLLITADGVRTAAALRSEGGAVDG